MQKLELPSSLWSFCQIGLDVTMMTSSNQIQIFQKNILVNNNPHAKFDVSMTSGLEAIDSGHFAHFLVQNA